MTKVKQKIEFGDFQTPTNLATEIIKIIKSIFPTPEVVFEPNCGLGVFLKLSIKQWENECLYYGFDINNEYINKLKKDLEKIPNCYLEKADFFTKDWLNIFQKQTNKKILIIGNPPWVTNATLGTLNSKNIPIKTNFKQLRGLEAKMGKSNFDIAEWILIKLIKSLENCNGCIAMICKHTTATKVLKYCWLNNIKIGNSSIHIINEKKYFKVSVDTCLFITHTKLKSTKKNADVYSDISFNKKIETIGLFNKELVINLDKLKNYNKIDTIHKYKWRSGVKHDAKKVMELKYNGTSYINGFGDIVDIEENCIYPLLKSSDLGNKRLFPQKFVIITQKKVGENTNFLQETLPKTWYYLKTHGTILDNRKSSIYKKRPRFSIFGIGDYSFTPWKVAISAFYKNIIFSPIGQFNGKAIMVDDTCYFISCQSKAEAYSLAIQFNSQECQDFLKSLICFKKKRPVNIEILKYIV